MSPALTAAQWRAALVEQGASPGVPVPVSAHYAQVAADAYPEARSAALSPAAVALQAAGAVAVAARGDDVRPPQVLQERARTMLPPQRRRKNVKEKHPLMPRRDGPRFLR